MAYEYELDIYNYIYIYIAQKIDHSVHTLLLIHKNGPRYNHTKVNGAEVWGSQKNMSMNLWLPLGMW